MKKITTLFAVIFYVGSGQAQWSLTGNAGTNPSTNFIGTLDAKPLIFKTNGSFSGIIDPINRNNFWGDITSHGVISECYVVITAGIAI